MTLTPNKDSSETLSTMDTTRSMREKAKAFGRCIINIIKCWKMCKKTQKGEK